MFDLFKKTRKKFTTEEKLIIENIFNEILKKDKKSNVTESGNGEGDPFPGEFQQGFGHPCGEYIFRRIFYKNEEFAIYFVKIFVKDLNQIQIVAHSIIFGNISIDDRFYADLKYEKNNLLSKNSKKDIEANIKKQILKSINKEFKST